MKLHSIVLPLTLPLVLLLAATGCHKSNIPVTKLNKPAPTGTADNTPATPPISPAQPIAPPTTPPVATPVPDQNPGHFATSDINLDNYTQDRAALAAYTVHFKFDSAVVETSEQANLTSVAQALSDANLKLLIEGHCDERGTEEYNRSLGERRALALREALAKLNIDPMRIKTLSFGKDKPVDPGHDEAAWAKNRRGEFVLLHPKTPAQ
jgi:peptidoglycan-associated lipoprotein